MPRCAGEPRGLETKLAGSTVRDKIEHGGRLQISPRGRYVMALSTRAPYKTADSGSIGIMRQNANSNVLSVRSTRRPRPESASLMRVMFSWPVR